MRNPVEGESIKCPVTKEGKGVSTYPKGAWTPKDDLKPDKVWEGADKRRYGVIPPHEHGAYGGKREKCNYEGHVTEVDYTPKKD